MIYRSRQLDQIACYARSGKYAVVSTQVKAILNGHLQFVISSGYTI